MLCLSTGLFARSEDGSFERTLSVSGQVDLDVKTDSGGISIFKGSSGSVRIHGILKADHDWFGSGDVLNRIHELERNPPIEQNGNRLRIGYVHERGLLHGISLRFEIETPAETQVRARADSGGIKVEGVNGPVDCKADSGGITIDDTPGAVHAAADSGGVHVSNAGSLFARVDSGGIEAYGIKGTIDAQADSGSVRVAQTSPAAITAKAESGGVTVKLAPGAGYDVRADTESGRVSVPEMTVHGSFSPSHVEGTIRGGGPLVSVHADSGSVAID